MRRREFCSVSHWFTVDMAIFFCCSSDIGIVKPMLQSLRAVVPKGTV